MDKRFVAELPRKRILCAGSELSTRVLRKVSSPTLFAHLGSPKVSVLNGRNEGRSKRGTLKLVKETPASAPAAGHGEQMRTVLAKKQYQDLQV